MLMTNHVHILCTPRQNGTLSQMMQSLGRSYVRYFNYDYQRTGTLLEGRYKSCLAQSDRYLLEVYRYIELNPVRAEMVADPCGNKWSSYPANALGHDSALCMPHQEYLALGTDPEKHRSNYRSLFTQHVDKKLLLKIRPKTNKCLAFGSDKFKSEIEELTGRRVTAKKRGRPLGWRTEKT